LSQENRLQEQSLLGLVDGQSGLITSIKGDDVVTQRLKDLGFWEGTVIQRVRSAPLGDPVVFRLRGFQMALRRDEAERVNINVGKEGTN